MYSWTPGAALVHRAAYSNPNVRAFYKQSIFAVFCLKDKELIMLNLYNCILILLASAGILKITTKFSMKTARALLMQALVWVMN